MRKLIFLGLTFWLVSALCGQTPSLIICKGSGINYKEFNTGNSLPSVSWKWTFQGGVPGTSALREPTVSYPDTGLFLTTCQSTFSDSSKQTQTIWVLVIESVFEPIPMRDTVFCGSGITMNLNAGNNFRGAQYHWTSTDVNLSGKDTNNRTLTITQPGTYAVKVYSKCGSTSKSITVRQGVQPQVDLGNDRFVCRNANVLLDAGFGNGFTYLWSPGNETTQTIVANIAGDYSVTVSSPDGCIKTDAVSLIDSCPPVFFIPNAFTPNDAAPNDVFQPYLEGFTQFSMLILNRWGQIVYKSTDMKSGWDGNYMGKPAITGVYACRIELMGTDKIRRIYTGNITLLR
ncbi:MAG: gliding motility-associated C-terminal domain-containing protein [Sphingomonadales bacterium]|nr:gliding motility-associated C-terminal domain-containing protein [Sphingomonadales bacterium]